MTWDPAGSSVAQTLALELVVSVKTTDLPEKEATN